MNVIIEHSSAELYGSDRSLLAIVAAIIDRGGAATVLLPADGPLVSRLNALGAQVHITELAVLRRQLARKPSEWWSLGRAQASVRRLAGSLVQRVSPDVVISNTAAMISGRRLARVMGVPHVQIVREIFGSKLERAAFARIVSRSDSLVFVSEAALEQFAPRLRKPSHVIPSGAELVHTTVTPRSHDTGPLRIVCVGRINAWKGQDTLLRAASRLNANGTPILVRIVGGEYGGGDEMTRALRLLADELGIDGVTEFVGEVPDATPHYEWADISVTPSKRAEPFGKVVIEAMNASRPVVATAAGGPAEVLADGAGGRLFPPDDDEGLANAIIELSDEETWLVASRQAFDKSSEYSATRSAERIIETIPHAKVRS